MKKSMYIIIYILFQLEDPPNLVKPKDPTQDPLSYVLENEGKQDFNLNIIHVHDGYTKKNVGGPWT